MVNIFGKMLSQHLGIGFLKFKLSLEKLNTIKHLEREIVDIVGNDAVKGEIDQH